jgi:hypothetical protein
MGATKPPITVDVVCMRNERGTQPPPHQSRPSEPEPAMPPPAGETDDPDRIQFVSWDLALVPER